MSTPQTRIVIVKNAQGLHARPAHALVQLASKYESTIMIGKASELVDCKSILSILTLGAADGTELTISADGEDATNALETLSDFFEAGFEGADSAVDS